MVNKGLKNSTVCAGLTFFGIIPLEMPCFFTQRLPLSLVFEDGHSTCGLWLIKLHLRCAGVWLHSVDGWRRRCVCENSYRRPGHVCGPRLHFEIYPMLLLPLGDPYLIVRISDFGESTFPVHFKFSTQPVVRFSYFKWFPVS